MKGRSKFFSPVPKQTQPYCLVIGTWQNVSPGHSRLLSTTTAPPFSGWTVQEPVGEYVLESLLQIRRAMFLQQGRRIVVRSASQVNSAQECTGMLEFLTPEKEGSQTRNLTAVSSSGSSALFAAFISRCLHLVSHKHIPTAITVMPCTTGRVSWSSRLVYFTPRRDCSYSWLLLNWQQLL